MAAWEAASARPQFTDLNDPFELLSGELSDRANRKKFAAWKEDVVRSSLLGAS